MAERVAVVDLAKEFRVDPADIVAYCSATGINVRRAAALLTFGQAETLRRAHRAGRIYRRRDAPAPNYSLPATGNAGWAPTHCECCLMGFQYPRDTETPPNCKDCVDHAPAYDEDPAREIGRLKDHDRRWRDLVRVTAENASKYRRKMQDAFRSRDLWKRALVEVAIAHEPADEGPGCVCGADVYPCVTRRQLTNSNLGIAKEIERLEALPAEEFDEVMRGLVETVADFPWDDD